MKILVACEESQTVCKAFRARGHEAYSADIQEPSSGHPEWHILGDVLPLIDKKTKKKKRQTQWYYDTRRQGKRRGKVASKTPQGLANAMAEQWG